MPTGSSKRSRNGEPRHAPVPHWRSELPRLDPTHDPPPRRPSVARGTGHRECRSWGVGVSTVRGFGGPSGGGGRVVLIAPITRPPLDHPQLVDHHLPRSPAADCCSANCSDGSLPGPLSFVVGQGHCAPFPPPFPPFTSRLCASPRPQEVVRSALAFDGLCEACGRRKCSVIVGNSHWGAVASDDDNCMCALAGVPPSLAPTGPSRGPNCRAYLAPAPASMFADTCRHYL